MPVIHINQLEYAISHVPLLDKVSLTIEPKERVALIGRNGEGKSTFLKIIAGMIQPNRGGIDKQSHIDVAMLSQTLLPANEQTVYEAVAMGLSDIGKVLNEYHQLLEQMAHASDQDALFKRMDKLQQQIEKSNGWLLQQRIERVITELSLPADALMSTLSGGWRRRVALAQVLVREPDLLLLDEPTNHLDVETIQWLEEVLLNYPKAILFITHDRALLRKLATRIIELDRGNLTSYPNNYTMYLDLKEKALEEEQRHNALFDKKLSQEEAWIRQGVKARRTRNEGRVRNLEALRAQRAQRREQSKNPGFSLNTTSGQSKVIIKADNISFAYDNRTIIKPFSITIQKGDKIALIGPNGAGKTTLINLLMGTLEPDTGTITRSSHNQIAFYDQHRLQIDPEKTLIENVVEGSDTIELDGARKHVISYLNDFLFSPEKARSLAKGLSGGECNRLLLAKIFAKPANLLILDEPTNDLDVESLEVLETLLQNYSGTAIIISHDREFIDNIATHSIAFSGDGNLKTYFGGYSDWLWQKAPEKKSEAAPKNPKVIDSNKRELNAILIKIEKLEKQISDLNEKMAAPEHYTEENLTKLSKLQTELEQDYKQWESLC
jgi:ATP-binding cassette subfamily F protein uup